MLVVGTILSVPVGDEHRLVDAGEVGGFLLAPSVDGGELGAERAHRDGLVAMAGAFGQPCQELLAGPAPVRGPGEEEKLLGVLPGEQSSRGVEVGDAGHPVDAFTPAGPVPAMIILRTSCGCCCTITWAIMPPMENPKRST